MSNYKKLDSPKFSSQIFHPRQTSNIPSNFPHQNFDVEIDSEVILGNRLYIHSKSAPVILFFHGNGETVSDYEEVAAKYLGCGLNFFILTYRGYGWSTGIPDATSMMRDCLASFSASRRYLEKAGFTGSIFIMGRSIGSAPAIETCAQFSDIVKGLIIESGFAETIPLLQNIGCTDTSELTEDCGFRNREKMESIKLPTLILHGANDSIIPVAQAERLQSFSGARTKKFFVIPGADHNSMISMGGEHYFSTILDFINDITGESSWRKRRKRYREK